jgi:hypothetical protein
MYYVKSDSSMLLKVTLHDPRQRARVGFAVRLGLSQEELSQFNTETPIKSNMLERNSLLTQ